RTRLGNKGAGEVVNQRRVAAVATPQRLPNLACQARLLTPCLAFACALDDRRPLLFDQGQLLLPEVLEGVFAYASTSRLGDGLTFIFVFQVILQQLFQVVVGVINAFLP